MEIPVILLVWLAVMACMAFLLWRNEHVFKYRIKVLNDERFSLRENLDRYERLPEYQTMFWQLFTWEWDVGAEKVQ